MKFRLFQSSDIDLYLRWVNQPEIWELDNPGPYEFRTVRSFNEQWAKIVGWRRSWMIELEERPIGYIGFITNEDDELTDEFFIVIGETSEWGKGHGKLAMAWLFGKAREVGLNALSGQVLGNNLRALAFYESLGFRVIGEGEPKFERNGNLYATIRILKPLD